MLQLIKILVGSLLIVFFLTPLIHGQSGDERNIENGTIIPDESYSDQPYIVKTDDGAWLCVMTTGSGIEGASGQHIITQRSFDQGRTWVDVVDVEPGNGPEASYAVLLKAPSGRIYVFYNHNSENLRAVIADDPPFPGGICKRVDSQGHFVFKYSDDHGKSWSSNRYDIPQRDFEIDRQNAYGGKIKFFWNVGKPFVLNNNAYVPIHKVGGFGYGFFTKNEGAILKSNNLLFEVDPLKIRWETLPEGDIGLRTPPGGGPIAAEQSYSVLSDGSLFCVYRTIDGHPAFTYSRDAGKTWDIPKYLSYANGRLIKHPRAANFAWRCENGNYLYWFHNHGIDLHNEHPSTWGQGYQDRNPVWLAGGIEKNSPKGKIIVWSQPEILLYDDDPLIRISYPDLVEEYADYYITETQKDIARVHQIDNSLLQGLWDQFTLEEKIYQGLLKDWDLHDSNLPIEKEKIILEPFYTRDSGRSDHGGKHNRNGFTIDLGFRLDQLGDVQTLLDTRNTLGQGLWVGTTMDSVLRIQLSDGRATSIWNSDKNTLVEHKDHYVSIIVDGGPKLILFVIDGILNDGGQERQFGWGRFHPHLQDINSNVGWRIGQDFTGQIHTCSIYNRALRISEAISNYRYSIKN